MRFAKTIDLRVAQIVKIERHPKAEKLYIETLKTAPDSQEERIIVSGLVPFFKEEELLNKKIILANNLKPAKLRGVESKGMLLAAEDHNGPQDAEGKGTMRVEVLDGGDAPIGTKVLVEGLGSMETPTEIDIDTFFSIPMEVKDSVVTVDGKALTLEGKPIRTKVVSQGNVH